MTRQRMQLQQTNASREAKLIEAGEIASGPRRWKEGAQAMRKPSNAVSPFVRSRRRRTSGMSKTALVAVGGNSLIRAGEKGTIAEQLANTRRTAAAIRRSHSARISTGDHPRQRTAGRRAVAALGARLGRGLQPDAGRLRRREPGRDWISAGAITAQ